MKNKIQKNKKCYNRRNKLEVTGGNMEWSKKQKQAIEERNKNILVAAAAGSGKTAVLVERIKQLIINDQIEIDQMLIVTFTNAAASEMRERISNAIIKALEADYNNTYLREQLNKINRANISTFHTFCMEVIRKYFYLIDIEPQFKICDEAQAYMLKEESMEDAFDQAYEEGEKAFTQFIDQYAGSRNDENAKEIIREVHSFILSIPNSMLWLKNKVSEMELPYDSFRNTENHRLIQEEVKIKIKDINDCLHQALLYAREVDGPKAYEALLLEEESFYKEISELHKNQNNQYVNMIRKFEFKKMPAQRGECNHYFKTAAKNLRDYAKKIHEQLLTQYMNLDLIDYVDEINYGAEAGNVIYKLVRAYDACYKEKKKEKGLLDFSDLEHYALEILNDEEVAKEYQEKFEHIFVDEYQDSNLVQETLIGCIKKSDNVFRVGDVKQSIYRFRLADPTLFLDRYKSSKTGELPDDITIDLNQNFRSKKHIINGTNFIFKNLMNSEIGEIEYDEDAYLYLGVDNNEKYDFPITANIIDTHENKDADLDEDIKELKNVELEAHFAASEIKKYIGDTIYDTKLKTTRQVNYGDIVILLRTVKKWSTVYYDVLMSHNIPAFIDDSDGYFETVEVSILLNLIALVDNFYQDIPLLSVLRSNIGQFSIEELGDIRSEKKDKTYYQAFESYCDSGLDAALKAKCLAFREKIESWKSQATYLTLEDFLWMLLNETNYYQYISALPGGQQRQANIKLLIEKAKAFQNTSMKGLFNFIKFMEQIKNSNAKVNSGKIVTESEQVVRIMSTHKSKGLEFPIVLLGGLGKRFNNSMSKSKVACHKDIGIGLTIVNKEMDVFGTTIIHDLISRKQMRESIAEEMRILYVAFTRAQDRLVLLGTVNDIMKKYEKWANWTKYDIEYASSPIDWILPVLLRKYEVYHTLSDELDIEPKNDTFVIDDSKWDLGFFDKVKLKQNLKEKKEVEKNLAQSLKNGFENTKEEMNESVNAIMSYEYQYKEDTSLPSKMSVSEIKRKVSGSNALEQLDQSIQIKPPNFMKEKRKYTPMEIGTLMHMVMQYIPLERQIDQNEIAKIIFELKEKELINEEESKLIRRNQIEDFFSTALGKRMIASKYVGREVHFNLKKNIEDILPREEQARDNQVIIQGTIDNYFQEDDGLVLIDYKTDYISSEENIEKINYIIDGYKVQLDLYQEALETIKNEKVKEKYIYFFSINKYFRL